MRFLRDQAGTVMIETAIVMAVLVLPVAVATAQFAPPAVAWIKTTSTNLQSNSDLQRENNELLKELLAKEGQQPDNSAG